jgi:hypothetical protein
MTLAEPIAAVHVEPTPAGRWAVRLEDSDETLSEHPTVNDAEHRAHAFANAERVPFVLLHDRYTRVRRIDSWV